MAVTLNPYLHFTGQAREAMQFYKEIFGGNLKMSTFAEGMHDESESKDQIMHAQLDTDNGMTLMASDNPPHMSPNPGESVTLSLSGDDESTLRRYWDRLSEGAQITVPLEKAPWGDTFGMLVDKFGMNWMVNVSA